MDIKINNQTFLVCGATSGFGKGTAMALMDEGAKVIGVARSKDKLDSMVASLGVNSLLFREILPNLKP
jgi:3-oxoacyl-[acyl-carrier protein] reductase